MRVPKVRREPLKPPQGAPVLTDAESDAALELADKVVRATKELIRANGDASMLLPEEVEVLIETGCAGWEDGRLLLEQDWAETFDRAWNGPRR